MYYKKKQVKVWFQNRRTKQKKDQGKDSDVRSTASETAATCSVLRLLEQGRLLSPPGLSGILPCATNNLGSSLRSPIVGLGTTLGTSSLTVGTSGAPTLSTTHPGHSVFSMPVPSLIGTVATRLASPLTVTSSLTGNLHELSARYLSSSAFEPYSRNGKRETMDKKIMDWQILSGNAFCWTMRAELKNILEINNRVTRRHTYYAHMPHSQRCS